MKSRRFIVIGLVVVSVWMVIFLAASRYSQGARGQVVPGPVTTPQPTVPCTPPGLPGPNGGCGKGTGIQRDVAYAWIDRFCNGGAVPTPPGETTFSVNYALGGQASGPVQFFGVAKANGVVVPTAPLLVLQPGQKDTRVRTAVVPNGTLFEITLTGTVVATGQPVIFGNGSTTRIRMASGACPTLTPVVPPVSPVTPVTPTPAVPTTPAINTLPPGVTFPPTE
jgi:hypothetical protein